jgi:hypothetical protein
MDVYSKIAIALDSMADIPDTNEDRPDPPEAHPVVKHHPAIVAMMIVSARAHAFLETIPQVDTDLSSALITGERIVEISGYFAPEVAPSRHDPIVLPILRTTADYAAAPCKHECAVLKHTRYVRQAHAV